MIIPFLTKILNIKIIVHNYYKRGFIFILAQEQPNISNLIEKDEEIMFDTLDYSSYENIITNKLVGSFESARAVFLAIQVRTYNSHLGKVYPG